MNKKTGTTALHIAAKNNSFEEIIKLTSDGLDVNAINDWGWTPVYFSIINSSTDAVKFLTEKGACINIKTLKGNHTPLHYAAGTGNPDIIKLITAQGADISPRDEYNYTPLHFAVRGGHMAVIRHLLKLGADINAKTNRGATPLHWAVLINDMDLVKLLLAKGADFSIKDKWGNTPAGIAGIKKYEKIQNFILKAIKAQ